MRICSKGLPRRRHCSLTSTLAKGIPGSAPSLGSAALRRLAGSAEGARDSLKDSRPWTNGIDVSDPDRRAEGTLYRGRGCSPTPALTVGVPRRDQPTTSPPPTAPLASDTACSMLPPLRPWDWPATTPNPTGRGDGRRGHGAPCGWDCAGVRDTGGAPRSICWLMGWAPLEAEWASKMGRGAGLPGARSLVAICGAAEGAQPGQRAHGGPGRRDRPGTAMSGLAGIVATARVWPSLSKLCKEAAHHPSAAARRHHRVSTARWPVYWLVMGSEGGVHFVSTGMTDCAAMTPPMALISERGH